MAQELMGPVRGERTADIVARRIIQAILEGQLVPGTRLREESLAKTFAVSRTPVREALLLLSGSGLVELSPNRGAMVRQLTVEDINEIYHLRAVLEAEAASLAARRVTPDTVDLLDKGCDRLSQLHSAPASEQLAADTFFHYGIAEASGSSRLFAMIRQVSATTEAYRASIAYTGEDMTEAERQHRAIAAALRKHRPAEAARLMRSHVHWAGEMAVDRLEGLLHGQ
jgi:DNA-binding GntR family transcriptional regulator